MLNIYSKMPFYNRNRYSTVANRRYGNRDRRFSRYKPRYPYRKARFSRSMKRQQNLTTLSLWFKDILRLQSNVNGNFRQYVQPNDVVLATEFLQYASLWTEYKVEKVIVKYNPAALGSESLQENTNQAGVPSNAATFKRGNVVSWIDNGTVTSAPGSIDDIINKTSAHLVQPHRYFKRYMMRPSGNPRYGRLNDNGSVDVQDYWSGAIQIYGENFSPSSDPGSQIWYYVQVMWKVQFRGRQEG